MSTTAETIETEPEPSGSVLSLPDKLESLNEAVSSLLDQAIKVADDSHLKGISIEIANLLHQHFPDIPLLERVHVIADCAVHHGKKAWNLGKSIIMFSIAPEDREGN